MTPANWIPFTGELLSTIPEDAFALVWAHPRGEDTEIDPFPTGLLLRREGGSRYLDEPWFWSGYNMEATPENLKKWGVTHYMVVEPPAQAT